MRELRHRRVKHQGDGASTTTSIFYVLKHTCLGPLGRCDFFSRIHNLIAMSFFALQCSSELNFHQKKKFSWHKFCCCQGDNPENTSLGEVALLFFCHTGLRCFPEGGAGHHADKDHLWGQRQLLLDSDTEHRRERQHRSELAESHS